MSEDEDELSSGGDDGEYLETVIEQRELKAGFKGQKRHQSPNFSKMMNIK